MKKVLKFLFLPYQKKKLLGQSLITVSAIRLGLWIFPFKVLNRWLCAFAATESDDRVTEWNVIDSVTAAVQLCSRCVPYASCLTQALAARTLLGLKGQNSQLKIGVGRDEDGKFMAHAWVEIDGKIIIGKLPQHHSFNVLKSSGSVTI
jgi:hypothetical protein